MSTRTSTTSAASFSQNKEKLQRAGNIIDKFIRGDQNAFDLSGLLGVATHKLTNFSGTSDTDYPDLSQVLPNLATLPLVGQVVHTPLPPELIKEFDKMQCNCAMGLMPAIKRAWFTVDCTVYMWNYEDGKDLAYFDGLKEVIEAVGLVSPRPGVFQEHIEYLLCLTTPYEIVLLGVSFTASATDPFSEMQLLPAPLFTIPSDNLSITSVTGTANGRIFLAGQDGSLHEVVYQAKDGWFYPKCRMVNHSVSRLSFLVPSFLSLSHEDPLVQVVIDDSRHVLYTRSKEGTIQVFDLGKKGQSMSQVAHMTLDTIIYRGCVAISSADRKLFQPLVHLAVLPASETSTLHLMAITQAGLRLYFTTTPDGTRNRPSLLALVHVRLPPGYCSSSASSRPRKNVHKAFYRRGCLMLACPQADDQDTVLIIDPDLYPFQTSLVESFVTYSLIGRTWAMAESIEVGELEASESSVPLPPAVVTQHAQAQRRFIFLTTRGSYLLSKPRPVDQLAHLLQQSPSGCCDVIESFFRLHGPTQACAMCLILAAGPNRQVGVKATEAYFKYGGEPRFIFPTTLGYGNQSLSPGSALAPYPQPSPHPDIAPGSLCPPAAYSLTNIHPSPVVGATLGRAVVGPEVMLSGKHDGFCAYLSRLLRPLWNVPMVYEVDDKAVDQPKKFFSYYEASECAVLLEQLLALKNFVERNQQFFLAPDQLGHVSPSNIHQRMLHFMRPDRLQTDTPAHVQKSLLEKYKLDAFLMERNSLEEVYHLLIYCSECLAAWKLLCEHKFDVIANKLDANQKLLLHGSTFKTLSSVKKELFTALIKGLFKHYAGDPSLTDPLSARLQQLAPSLFSRDDAVASKAHEHVTVATTMAKANQSAVEVVTTLRESLKLFSQVTHKINLSHVCNQYRALRYYEGIIQLSLCTAKNVDPQNLALHFYKSHQPPEDVNGLTAFNHRKQAYAVITQTLAQLLTQLRTPSFPTIPMQAGPPPKEELTIPDPDRDFEAVITLALRTDDELLHVTVFSWLLDDSVKLADRLINLKSPFIEDFLKYKASLKPDSEPILNILWRYYEKNQNYLPAAKILHQMAHLESPSVTLDQRIECISRAVICAKSGTLTTGVSRQGEFLHELEEKMEVARIQMSIIEALVNQPASQERNLALKMLKSTLMDISKLYGDFAEPFNLSECKLAIVFSAGHYDPTLVETLWKEIIDQELQSTTVHHCDTRMHSMRAKMQELGHLYAKRERYFPVAYLVKVMEQYCCQLGWNADFTFKTFVLVGVSYPALFSIYDRLFREKDSCWQEAGHPLHILASILSLLDSFIKNPSVLPTHERLPFRNITTTAVNSYLVELQTMSPSTPDIAAITANLRSIESQLQRVM